MTTTDTCIKACNSLLRGEISAIETYSQTIHKFETAPEVATLERIRHDHITSANALRENVTRMGGTPSTDSGAWGTWARMVQGAAKLMGEGSALKGLLEGEEHGQKEYEDALESDDMMPECKDLVRTELLPRQLRHIATLEQLRNAR